MRGQDLAIIDFDDVLIDSTKSLLNAAIRTVDVYLNKVIGLKGDDVNILSYQEVEQFASAYGFEPGPDLAYALIVYMLTLLDKQYDPAKFEGMDPKSILDYIKNEDPPSVTMLDLKRKKRLSYIGKPIRIKGGGMKGLNRLGDLPNRFLVFYEGHIAMDNYLKRVFEEVYLGEELFKQEYGHNRVFAKGTGTIHMEEPRFSQYQFEKIMDRYMLATITNRSKARVLYILDLLGLTEKFVAIVTGQEPTKSTQGDGVYGADELGVAEAQARNFTAEITSVIEQVTMNSKWALGGRALYIGDVSKPEKNMVLIKDRYQLFIIGFSLDRKKKIPLKAGGADVIAFDINRVFHYLMDKKITGKYHTRWGM